MRAAIYARVSTLDQHPENQLAELRRYMEPRSWTWQEYVDKGVSGEKDIQAQIGHVSPQMMKTYSHVRRLALDEAAAVLEPTFEFAITGTDAADAPKEP